MNPPKCKKKEKKLCVCLILIDFRLIYKCTSLSVRCEICKPVKVKGLAKQLCSKAITCEITI